MNGSCHLPHFASTGDECCQNHPFLLHYESELLSTVTTPLYVLLVANVLQSGALALAKEEVEPPLQLAEDYYLLQLIETAAKQLLLAARYPSSHPDAW